MKQAGIKRLEGGDVVGVRRFMSEIKLAEGKKTSTVTLTRTGSFFDRRYGRFEITRPMLLSMVENFKRGVYGQDIFIDVAHKPENGAAARIKSLTLSGNRLRADVEWTPFGIQAVRDKGYQYLSAEFHDDFEDNEAGEKHGPTLLGAGLTVRPVIKRLDPVRLAAEGSGDVPVYLHPQLVKKLSEESQMNLQAFIAALSAALGNYALSEPMIAQLVGAFEDTAKQLGEDEPAIQALQAQFEQTGKTLAEQVGAGTSDVSLKIELPQAAAAKTLSEDDINAMLDKRAADEAQAAKKLSDDQKARVSQFETLINEADGLKTLSEAQREELLSARDLIHAGMTEDQVIKLADNQIRIGNQLSVSEQMAQMGMATGTPRISVDDSNNIKALQENIDRRLGLMDLSDARRYANTGGELQPENKALADKAIALYDAEHGADLHREHKMLAGGDGVVSDVAVPAIFERTVLRDSLYRLVGLQFADSGTLPFASSALIPYSYRDTAAAGRNNTRVYEGGSIARAGVIQTSETAYPIPQKLAFEVSDELRHLTGSGILNWEAVAENQRNATRIISEDLEQMIFNEQLRAADEYGAVAVVDEDIGTRFDTSLQNFILANFPVVRPRSVYDLQGNQVGSTVNPITVTYNASDIDEYDGTGTQAAGTYWSLDYNLGIITLVDEAGAVVTPAGASTMLVDYSYATNVYAFNTDLGSALAGDHWDTFLYRYGLRKSVIEDDRFHMANFGLMSGSVMTQAEQAKQFGANHKRPGTDLQMDGNLGRVKDVPNFKTSAPGLWMGDQRIIIGERGQTRLRMMKPWSMGELENQKDANGRFTGKKEAYGDQFLVLHTPTQLKAALTSMVLYSATTRVDS